MFTVNAAFYGGTMSKMNYEPVFMKPYFQHNIWGGRKLETEFGFDIPDGDVGECWAVSAYPGCESVVSGGDFDGLKLSDMWAQQPEFFGDLPEAYRAAGYPFITKIIDAKNDLSIQVHPDDEYAGIHENGARGKTECWYILDCPDDAELVLGHNAKTREEFTQMIEEKRWNDLLRRVRVRQGDFIQLEPGTIHAITAGVMLLETQQSSDVTYRLYDYDRLQNGKPRELHIRQSIDVATIPAGDPEKLVKHTENAKPDEDAEIEKCKFYEILKLPVQCAAKLDEADVFTIVTVTEGRGNLVMERSGSKYALRKGDSLILPAGWDNACFDGNMNIIAARSMRR